jgi:hypothetical protein
MIKLKAIIFLTFMVFCLPSYSELLKFDCEYPVYSSEDAHGKKGYEDFELEFMLDTITEKAFLVGNNGMSEVTFVPNEKGWSFIETTGTGNITATTITQQFKSVHSRNTILTNLVATQYYGDCKQN